MTQTQTPKTAVAAAVATYWQTWNAAQEVKAGKNLVVVYEATETVVSRTERVLIVDAHAL